MPSSNAPSAPALVLFDIDGTLIRRAGPHHREALVEAIRDVSGLDTTTEGIPLHGMLDPDIITVMMRKAGAGLPVIRRSLPAIARKAESLYLRTCPRLENKQCPGARAVLDLLRQNHAVLGLVTGNLTRIGWKKMEMAGLADYFDFGAFGGMAGDREGLVRLALGHARSRGILGPGTPVSLIGDAPNDVRAAKANRIRSIAVLTGISTPEEIARVTPDVTLNDLRELRPEMVF